ADLRGGRTLLRTPLTDRCDVDVHVANAWLKQNSTINVIANPSVGHDLHHSYGKQPPNGAKKLTLGLPTSAIFYSFDATTSEGHGPLTRAKGSAQ
ncbi:hypothetical protein Q6280_27100, partial [Klebsiella pneumoniae]|uniref:hypothetical protein n=1 Tax=Klebsiella pneumoniae TaxID=573 RepID=UPI0027300AAB